MSEDDSKLQQWKQKYFDALEQAEGLEKQLAQLSEICGRGLSRLSLAAEGASADLDAHLSKLRASVKNPLDSEELAPIIDQISDTVTQLQDARAASDIRFAPLLKPLLEPFDNDRLEKKVRKLFVVLTNEIDEASPTFTMESWLLDYARQIRELTDILIDSSAPQEAGILSKIFKSSDATQANDPDEMPGLTLQINSALVKLLDEIPLPSVFEPEMISAQQQLNQNTNIHVLPELLDGVVALLIKASQEEAEEFTSFLKSLNERLDSIQNYLDESTQDQTESVEERKELDTAVRTQVAEIQEKINSSDDVVDLRSSIHSRLEIITEKMGNYWTAEEKRQADETRRIEQLTLQLDATEQESQKLRQALIEQQARAHKDPLTHIPNRQAYNERLAYEEARFKRYAAPLSMVVCDIDHFKKFNDNFGHLAGDKVLCTVASVIAENIRSTDFVARYGGEEFVVIMPETTKEQAQVVAEKLRTSIAEQSFKFRDQSMSVTMSFGIAQFAENQSGEDVFHVADKALYSAKENGRNRVAVA